MNTKFAEALMGSCPALAVRVTKKACNEKLGLVWRLPGETRPHRGALAPFIIATSVSTFATCPDSCPLKGSPGRPGGCYSEAGFTRIAMQKMDAAAWRLTAEQVIAEEARQIKALFRGGPIPQDGARGGRDLRLHVGGEVGSEEGARLLADAAIDFQKRGGGAVFTMTHLWRSISHKVWGPISVLASVDRPEEIAEARSVGYAAAVVVAKFANGSKVYVDHGTRFIPCSAETRIDNTCTTCRLCMDADKLFKRSAVVVFKVHGRQAAAAIKRLHTKAA